MFRISKPRTNIIPSKQLYSMFWGSENNVRTQYPFIEEFLKRESTVLNSMASQKKVLVDLFYKTETIVDMEPKESGWVEAFHSLVSKFVLERQMESRPKQSSHDQLLSDLIQKYPSPVAQALFYQLQLLKEMYWNTANISEWEQMHKQLIDKYSLYKWGKEMYPTAGKRLRDMDKHLESYSNYLMLITLGKQVQKSETKQIPQVDAEKEHSILQQSEAAIQQEPSIALGYITRGIFQANKVGASNVDSIESDILRYLEDFDSDFVARELLSSVYEKAGRKNSARDQLDLASKFRASMK